MPLARPVAAITLCGLLQLCGANVFAQAAPPAVHPPTAQAVAAGPQSPAKTRRPAVFHHASVETAWQSAKVNQRPLVVMFTSDSCRYCTKMMTETYGHPAIQRMLAIHSETVLAHAKTNKALVERLGIRAYPTSLVVSPQGQIVAAIEGFVEPQQFAQRVAPLLAPAPPGPATPANAARQASAVSQTRAVSQSRQ